MPVDIERLEAVIESACRTAVRRGYVMGNPPFCACPLHAVCIADEELDVGTGNGARILGLTFDQEREFVRAYDNPSAPIPGDVAHLGRRLRSRVDAGLFSRAVVCPEML